MDKQQREAQREAVKVLAIAVGVREAARQLGLNENTVISWSKRDDWFKDTITPKPPQQALAITAIKPSDALRSALEDDNRTTRLGLSKATRKASEVLAEADGEFVLAKSEDLRRIVSSAARIHNWEAVEQGSGVMGGLRVYSQQTVIAVNQD